MSDLRKAAVTWARRGFRVFPLAAGSKEPIAKGWTETATANPVEVAKLWTDPVTGWGRPYNIGVLTDEMIVVDVDEKDGRNGMASFIDEGFPLDTLVVKTPSGGRHVYYTGPSKSLSVGKLARGLDIRSYHGYVVAPGSVVDAGVYEVENDAPLLPAPATLVARLDEPSTRQSQTPLADVDPVAAEARGAYYLLNEAPIAREGDGGDAVTFRVACALKDYGVSQDAALLLLAERWNERCVPPWSLDDLKAKVENAYAYGKSAPGIASAEADLPAGLIPEPVMRVKDAPASSVWLRHGDSVPRETFLYDQLLPREGVAGLIGPSQGGKSFVVVDLARSLATGKAFFGIEPEMRGGTVILFGGTEGSGFLHRLAALQEPGRLPISAVRAPILRERGALGDVAAQVQMESRRMFEEHGMQARLLVIETMSAVGLVEDENSNVEAAQAIANLEQLGRLCGCLVIFTHHPTKDGKGSRGAGAFRDNADYCLEIQREGKSELRELELTKARNAAQRRLGAFTLMPVKVGLDEKGRDVTSMTISTATTRRATREPKHIDLLRDAYEWAQIAQGDDYRADVGIMMGDVRELFRDRVPGSKDSSNVKKMFDKAWQHLEEVGALKVRSDGLDKFIVMQAEI